MKTYTYIIIFLLLSTFACKKENMTEAPAEKTDSASVVSVSDVQAKSLHLLLGQPEQRQLSTEIIVNGKLDVPPQNLVTIAAPMGGFVKHTDMLEGMKIRKGDVLVSLMNPDYIQLQQDYLDGKSKLEFLEAEYRRQQALAKDSINSGKSLQQATSNYNSMKAMVAGYAAKLALIHIDPNTVTPEKITSTILLRAPMNGYITSVNVNIGQYVNASDVMIRMVNTEHLHAELYVFEKDASSLSIGQDITVKLAGDTSEWKAKIYLIGKEITADRTIRVHGHFKDEHENLIPGMYVTARIATHPKTTASLPSTAIINFEGQSFVFVERSANRYEMTPVKTGETHNGFVSLDGTQRFQGRVVLEGGMQLLSMLKNTEEE